MHIEFLLASFSRNEERFCIVRKPASELLRNDRFFRSSNRTLCIPCSCVGMMATTSLDVKLAAGTYSNPFQNGCPGVQVVGPFSVQTVTIMSGAGVLKTSRTLRFSTVLESWLYESTISPDLISLIGLSPILTQAGKHSSTISMSFLLKSTDSCGQRISTISSGTPATRSDVRAC